MRLYFVKKYLLNVSALALSLIAVSGSPSELGPLVLVASSIIAAVYTHRQFTKKGIWPLYDNLGISRAKLIVLGLALRPLL